MQWFIERLAEFSEREAIISKGNIFTYADVLSAYMRLKAYLADENVRSGQVVALMGDYSLQTCSLLIALIENKNIIVPVSSYLKNQYEYLLKTACVDRVIVLDNDRCTNEERQGSDKHTLIEQLVSNEEAGLILFTSGSTGIPKAVVHSFTKLMQKYKSKRQPLRTITLLLLDHIGGINTLFHTLANGGTVITTDTRNPKIICELIEKYRVELLPASPSFLNMLLLTEHYRKHDMSSLKIITYGTEVIPETTLGKLCEAFPQVRLKQTYGLSELGILSTKSRSSDSVWVKVGGEGYETKVVDNILYIKADSAMLGYMNAPSPFDNEGWFNTQDEVVTDGDYIRILGRKSDIINVGGQKVYPAEVENVLLKLPNVSDVMVKGEAFPIVGNIVVAVFNLITEKSVESLKTRVYTLCQDKLERYKIPVKVIITKEELFNSRLKKKKS